MLGICPVIVLLGGAAFPAVVDRVEENVAVLEIQVGNELLIAEEDVSRIGLSVREGDRIWVRFRARLSSP